MKFEKASSNTPKPTKRWQWIDASSRKGLPEDYRPTFQKQRRRWVATFTTGWFLLCALMVFNDAIFKIIGYRLSTILPYFAAVMFTLITFITAIIRLEQDKSIRHIAQSPLTNLDERQKQVRLQASEIAYNLVVGLGLIAMVWSMLAPASFRYVVDEVLKENVAFPLSLPFFLYVFLKPCIVAWLEPDPIPDDTVSIRQTAH